MAKFLFSRACNNTKNCTWKLKNVILFPPPKIQLKPLPACNNIINSFNPTLFFKIVENVILFSFPNNTTTYDL